jgi:hypothetical protein
MDIDVPDLRFKPEILLVTNATVRSLLKSMVMLCDMLNPIFLSILLHRWRCLLASVSAAIPLRWW